MVCAINADPDYIKRNGQKKIVLAKTVLQPYVDSGQLAGAISVCHRNEEVYFAI